MGWLRDYMTAAQPPIPSFGRLAAACLDHPAWPVGLQPKERSLSTLFSKLDRKKDLDWLRERVDVQRVLAHILKRPLSDLRSTLGEETTPGSERYVRLVDVRYAREIDLGKEDLPPGIPRVISSPPSWGALFWHAPSGSGRTLAARWLNARGLAHVLHVRTHDDLWRAPERGPLLIEVDSTASAEHLPLSRADLEMLRIHQRPLCIAAPYAPPDGDFERIESPEPAAFLPELIDWVGARLDGSGNFQPNRAESWIRKVALPAGAARTLGDLLGLLGMLDEVHPRSLLAKSLDELGEHFVKRRMREAAQELSSSPRLTEAAYETLKECAARVLVSGRNELLAPHPVDEWTALFSGPEEHEAPDPEWFSHALKGSLGAQVSRSDLRRAAKKLPPGAFQLTRHLEAAGLLVRTSTTQPEDDGLRTLHPRWLVSLLTARATQEVLRLAPSQWGQVLLTARRADDIVIALKERAQRDDWTPVFALLDDFDVEHPELVAALEGAVIAAGHVLLEGQSPPEEVVEGLLQAAAEDILFLAEVPEPRLTTEHGTWFRRDHFLTALGALCWDVPFPLRKLDPFRAESPLLSQHFHSATAHVLKSAEPGSPLSVGVLRFQNALFPESSEMRSPALRLIDSVSSADQALFQRALEQCHLETLVAYVKSSGQNVSAFVRGLWGLLRSEERISPLFKSAEALREFWRSCPTPIVIERMNAKQEIAWHELLPHQYADLMESDVTFSPEVGSFCPLDAMIARVERLGALSVPSAALRAAVARAPARFAPSITRFLEQGDIAQPRHLFQNTPSAARATLARALPPAADLLRLRPGPLSEVRAFLLSSCQDRAPNFEDCYSRLTDLERHLAPLKNLR